MNKCEPMAVWPIKQEELLRAEGRLTKITPQVKLKYEDA
jgi:hypothetical protein